MFDPTGTETWIRLLGPSYNDNFPVNLNIAPYVYNVSVLVSPNVFLYISNIVNYTVIVGTEHDCGKNFERGAFESKC